MMNIHLALRQVSSTSLNHAITSSKLYYYFDNFILFHVNVRLNNSHSKLELNLAVDQQKPYQFYATLNTNVIVKKWIFMQTTVVYDDKCMNNQFITWSLHYLMEYINKAVWILEFTHNVSLKKMQYLVWNLSSNSNSTWGESPH